MTDVEFDQLVMVTLMLPRVVPDASGDPERPMGIPRKWINLIIGVRMGRLGAQVWSPDWKWVSVKNLTYKQALAYVLQVHRIEEEYYHEHSI